MFSSVKLIALAICAQSVSAALFMTSPVASSSWAGGQSQTISWEDDGNVPTLASFGPALVTIAVGSQQQQTELQTVVANVNTATTSSVVFTPLANIGPNGADYFIRVQSLGLQDATNPQYPALAFSAKFTMTNMSGTFNATVQAQIDGASAPAASGAPATTPAAPAASTPASTPATSAKTTGSASGSASPTAGVAAKSGSGALGLVASGAAAIAGSVFAAAMLL
ncbi:hypothetical protein EUX98_g2355 [Antrodiella citrinella]|uniref:Yeast cell wall synthesis Kre9/Knh1-like N-terminal domain-containing protein n=1 Tax=Antrodiella citrinella TaxID=2447956 RepID=A0A4S4N7H5_9APHY|nr:hypothetical protein EUX98_g2355 [Antrodiella citrinella]